MKIFTSWASLGLFVMVFNTSNLILTLGIFKIFPFDLDLSPKPSLINNLLVRVLLSLGAKMKLSQDVWSKLKAVIGDKDSA